VATERNADERTQFCYWFNLAGDPGALDDAAEAATAEANRAAGLKTMQALVQHR
jgi:hypothetical protein